MTAAPIQLSALPNRLLRRKFYDPERVVAFLGYRPSLLDLDSERKRRESVKGSTRFSAGLLTA